MEEQPCIICSRLKAEGIRIYKAFICIDCEAEMVKSDVRDAKYPFFVHRMKRAWLDKDA